MDDNITDEEFLKIIERIGFDADMDAVKAFRQYYNMLVEKNKVMNLTAITEYYDVLIKHFADSLLVKSILDELGKKHPDIKPLTASKIVDVGTGAGFPGIPLKICSPSVDITLIDSLNKRIKFLDEVIKALKLTGIYAVHGRCEELGHNNEYREAYDLALSRAVADLSVLSEYCLPFVKTGGLFIAYKSQHIDEEAKNAANAVKSLGGELIDIIKKDLPGSDLKRSFCIIKKTKSCPSKFPRKAGTPAKQPL